MTALEIGTRLHKLHTGFIYHYTFLILIGVTVLFGFRQVWLMFGLFIDFRVLIFILLCFIIPKHNNVSIGGYNSVG